MKKTRGFLLAAAVAAMAFTFSCSSDDDGGGSVSYEGKKYNTVKIGNQTWLAENLNYAVEGSKCFNDDPANCTTYGRLYDWETAMTVCPSGWHLPSKEEWYALAAAVGGENVAGGKLKAKDGWSDYFSRSGGGTDDYGFSALPGGFQGSGSGLPGQGASRSIRNEGFWWTSSDYDSYGNYAYAINMGYLGNDLSSYGSDKPTLLSVRCVKD